MTPARGYSLLEVLITLTIVSILTMVAVPLYLNYDVRAKVAEGLMLVAPIETQVTEFYQTMGRWPSSNGMAGVEPPASYRTDYIDHINLSVGSSGTQITITYRLAALDANNTLIITPRREDGTGIQWRCTGGTLLDKYRPRSCRS